MGLGLGVELGVGAGLEARRAFVRKAWPACVLGVELGVGVGLEVGVVARLHEEGVAGVRGVARLERIDHIGALLDKGSLLGRR